MHRYIVLLIGLVLFIAGKRVVRTVDVINDVNVDTLENLQKIDENTVRKFYDGEKKIFRKVESLYKIGEQPSTSNLQYIGLPKGKDEILALAHVTFLTFWMAINFRICSLIFSIFENHNKEEYKPLKVMGYSLFKEMNFAFREFRKNLERSMAKNSGTRPIRAKENLRAIRHVLTLSLDFISDKQTLREQEPDRYSSEFIMWSHIPNVLINENSNYKTIFPSAFKIDEYKNTDICIEDMYTDLHHKVTTKLHESSRFRLFLHFIRQILCSNPSPTFTDLWEVFYKVKYTTSLRIWHVLKDKFTVNSKSAKVQRISKVIEIMKKIRQIHYMININSNSLPNVIMIQPQPGQAV